MNTLFNTSLKEEIPAKNPQATKTVEIDPVHYGLSMELNQNLVSYFEKSYALITRTISIELVEDGVTLNLTVVDTPGFGDQLNREHKYVIKSCRPVKKKIRLC